MRVTNGADTIDVPESDVVAFVKRGFWPTRDDDDSAVAAKDPVLTAPRATDVDSIRRASVDRAREEHPYAFAAIPRSMESAVRGDRNGFGSVLDATKDVTSSLGRAALAAVQGAGTAAGSFYGGSDIGDAFREGANYALKSMQRADMDNPDAGRIENIVGSIYTDPYALPLMAIGGPIASKALRIGPKAAKFASWAMDPVLNTAIGMTERGASEDADQRVLDPGAMALDAGVGILGKGAEAGMSKLGQVLLDKARTSIGGSLIERTPKKLRAQLMDQWSDVPRGSNIADKKESAARNIADYMMTDVEGNPVKLSFLSSGNANKRRMLGAHEEKLRRGNETLDEIYSQLESDYRGVASDATNPATWSAPEWLQMETNQELKDAGVDMIGALDRARSAIGSDMSIAPDMRAIDRARRDIIASLGDRTPDVTGAVPSEYGRLLGGTIGPEAARDLRNRIYDRAATNVRRNELRDYYGLLYKDINAQLEASANKRLSDRVLDELNLGDFADPDVAQARIRAAEAEVEPQMNLLSRTNAALHQGLSLEPGLEHSQAWNPNSEHSPFGHTMDLAARGVLWQHPIEAGRELFHDATRRAGLGKSLVEEAAPTHNIVRAATASATARKEGNKQKVSRGQRAEMDRLQTLSRQVTETEYRALQDIVSKPMSQRTADEINYARKYGVTK